MPRIVIFGNSGSGKSTLARQMAQKHSCPHLDLDSIAWDETKTEKPTRKSLASSIDQMEAFLTENSSWVIEGCYADLLEVVIKSSTEIVFLNPGVETCQENCRNRPWEPHKYESPEAQNANLSMLMGWIEQYSHRDDEFSLHSHMAIFKAFKGPKSQLTSNKRPE